MLHQDRFSIVPVIGDGVSPEWVKMEVKMVLTVNNQRCLDFGLYRYRRVLVN